MQIFTFEESFYRNATRHTQHIWHRAGFDVCPTEYTFTFCWIWLSNRILYLNGWTRTRLYMHAYCTLFFLSHLNGYFIRSIRTVVPSHSFFFGLWLCVSHFNCWLFEWQCDAVQWYYKSNRCKLQRPVCHDRMSNGVQTIFCGTIKTTPAFLIRTEPNPFRYTFKSMLKI